MYVMSPAVLGAPYLGGRGWEGVCESARARRAGRPEHTGAGERCRLHRFSRAEPAPAPAPLRRRSLLEQPHEVPELAVEVAKDLDRRVQLLIGARVM